MKYMGNVMTRSGGKLFQLLRKDMDGQSLKCHNKGRSRTHTQISNMELSGRSSMVSGRNYPIHSTHIHVVGLLGFFIHVVI